MISQHPILSAVPVEEGTQNPYFIRLPDIDITRVTTFAERKYRYDGEVQDVELDELVQDQHNQPFQHHKPEIPFWRLIIYINPWHANELTVLFVFHHSLADTGSGVIFHECFIAALSKPSANATAPNTLIRTLNAPILPPLEALHPLPVSEAFAQKERDGLTFLDVPEHIWSAGKTRVPMIGRFRSVAITAEDTQNFVRTCKEHSTSVTAALQTILASTLFNLLPVHYTTLVCDGAVSLRRWLKAPVDQTSMGCWVGSFSETYKRKRFSWDEARRSGQTIELAVSKGGTDMSVGCFHFIEDFNGYLSAKIGKKRSISFELSNVGAIRRYAAYRPWQLGRVLFSQSANAVGGAFKVSVATGNDMRLNLGFSWQEDILEEPFMNQVIQDVLFQIIELGNAHDRQQPC